MEGVDSAYWKRGCGSLGRLRSPSCCVLPTRRQERRTFCLMDIRGADDSAAPARLGAPGWETTSSAWSKTHDMSRRFSGNGCEPHVSGTSRSSSENYGRRISRWRSNLTTKQAMNVARFLAAGAGFAHARQMDPSTRAAWQDRLGFRRSRTLDAPWLWSSVVELLANHEGSCLEHCRCDGVATSPAPGDTSGYRSRQPRR